MAHQLPVGAKDLLPLDVLQKQWIEQRLQQTFQAWGYQKIITPSLEKLETLTAGGAVQPQSVIQLTGDDGDILGLRSEFTASIARAYAARLGNVLPQRLYYNANVFRQNPTSSSTGQQETFQAGVELLGSAGMLADAEILLLLADCLAKIEVSDWQMVLGHSGLTTALLGIFPIAVRTKVRQCFANLDRVQLEQLSENQSWRSLALSLLELRGNPVEVLAKLDQMLLEIKTSNAPGYGQWWQENAETVTSETEQLRSLLAVWTKMQMPDNLVLDLSLIQTIDYYTGIVFELVSRHQLIAQGGRYDQLLGLYHPQGKTYPGIGFCLHLEELQKVLAAKLPTQISPCDCLVVPVTQAATHQAFVHAAQLRQTTEQVVEVYLDLPDPEQTRSYGRSRGVQQIAWVNTESEPQILTEILC